MTKHLRYLFLPLAALLALAATAQPGYHNYDPHVSRTFQRVLVPLKPTQDTADVTISAVPENVGVETNYLDGLGRPIQKVVKQASPSKKDLVAAIDYDIFGRSTTQYLPYTQQTGNKDDGLFKQTALVYDSAFYHGLFPGENSFFSKTQLDASPLQRVLKLTPEGDSWTGANRGKSIAQRASTSYDSVRLWTIDINSEDDLPATSGYYAAGSLLVEEVTDEKGTKKVTYKNELGQVVLSRVQSLASPAAGHYGWLSTYYTYDEMGHLRYVLPPKAVEALIAVSWNLASNASIGTGLCYSYWYDSRGRNTMKYLPGTSKTYIAYDLLGRTVMTQDGNLRTSSEWIFIKYDAQDRPIKSGLILSWDNKDSILAHAAASSDYPTISGTYTVMSETYYDNYGWLSAEGNPVTSSLVTTNITSGNFYSSYDSSPEYAQEIVTSSRIRGAITGSKRFVLSSSTYLYSLPLYDGYGRVVQEKETNISGGTDVVTNQYSYSGRILRSHLAHQKSGTNAQAHTVLSKYVYDHAGRVTSVAKKMDASTERTILSNAYNELGQLATKALGSTIDTMHYEYNIRGWLLGMNRDFVKDANSSNSFGYEIAYDNTSNIISGQGYSQAMYDGNIAGMTWKAMGDGEKRKYDYTYDAVNRLKGADFNQYTSGAFDKSAGVDYSVGSLSYDANGNILAMQQKGLTVVASATIDDLSYTYLGNSNQLDKVEDAITADNKLGDFNDGTNGSSSDYSYNANGGLAYDYNKNIQDIHYNHLGLVDYVYMADNSGDIGEIYYVHDAGGTRVSKIINDIRAGGLQTTTTYMAGFTYRNDTLESIAHEEGRVRMQDTVLVYDYFIRDHLGNIRATLTDGQKTDVYQATMETSNATLEDALFSRVSSTATNKPSGFDGDGGNEMVSKLKGDAGGTIVGPGKLLKVMAGDHVDASVYGWYDPGETSLALGGGFILPVLDDIVTAVFGSAVAHTGAKGMHDARDMGSYLNPGVVDFLSGQNNSQDSVHAYLNWILLDEEQFKLVSGSSGFEQVPTIGAYDSKQLLQANGGSGIDIEKNGYLYVYLSNSNTSFTAYFDDLHIEHVHGKLVEETQYYPFGLVMAGISSKAANSASQKLKYNGKEEQKGEFSNGSGPEWTDYGARMYDNQIGRWHVVDPMAESNRRWSLYTYTNDNPIRFIDPDGMKLKSTVGQTDNHDTNMDDLGNDMSRPGKRMGHEWGSMEENDAKLFMDMLQSAWSSGGAAERALQFAGMCKYVYGEENEDPDLLIDGWQVSNREMGVTYSDETGFKSMLFERVMDGNVVEYCYAYAGTDASLKDVSSDAKQFLGLNDPQYQKAVDNAKVISGEIGDGQLTLTGHSLGGGLASLASHMTDRTAVTFNAAGLSWQTEYKYGTLTKSENRILAYIVRNEPLNYAQSFQLGLRAEGRIRDLPTGSWRDWLPFPVLQNHSINTVIHSLQKLIN